MSKGPSKPKSIEFPPPLRSQALGKVLVLRDAFTFAYKQWYQVAQTLVYVYSKYGDIPGPLKESAWGFSVSLIDTKLMYCQMLQRLRSDLAKSRGRVTDGRWAIASHTKDFSTISVVDKRNGTTIQLGAGAVPSDFVMVLKNRRSLGVEWSSVNFVGIFGKNLNDIRKKSALQVFDGRYGEIIYEHDKEVRSLKTLKVYLETVSTGKAILQRFAFRFPYSRPDRKAFRLIGVIAFDASAASVLAG
jgi:hypothetical protein